MDRSPNHSHEIHEASSESSNTNNNSNFTQSHNNSGFASMLSPRNIMKFFSKNIQQMASPRISSFIANINQAEPRTQSHYHSEDIHKQFCKYTDSIEQQMQKYKANCLKKLQMAGSQKQKQRQRQQIETEVKISKIPQQYFLETKQQQDKIQQQRNNSKNENAESEVECYKSKKLQSLLMISKEQSGKKSKSKRAPLSSKQEELQQYLDQVQVIIFSKARKYPDKYLHYLANLNHSDIQLDSLLAKVKHLRVNLQQNMEHVQQKYCRIKRMQITKRNHMHILQYLNIMKQLYSFKNQSENTNAKLIQQNSNTKQKIKSNELIAYIQHYPKLKQLHTLKSISSTLNNVQQLCKNIKSKKLNQICQLLHKRLTNNLNSIYSRDSWLKSQLPKDVLMVHKMKPQLQEELEGAEQGTMNNSFMNISVLDQSYCVGTHAMTNKNELGMLIGTVRQIQQITQIWKSYCQEYSNKNYKFQQQSQLIMQILQRSILKFSTSFDKNLEDYILFIYNQKSLNSKQFPTHKQRLYFIQPKFFNKIAKVYFQALIATLAFAQAFSHLSQTYIKMIGIIEQKILQILDMRSLTDYSLIQNHILTYEDVVQLISILEFWQQYASEVIDKTNIFEQQKQLNYIVQSILQFQQNLHNKKQKIIDQFLSNLHKFTLVNDLKNALQKQNFDCISIPVSSFSILDFIINWGQNLPNQQGSNLQIPQGIKQNEVQQSFNFGSQILGDLQSQINPISKKKNIKFSIFKVIDKKLIIEGKQYRICQSLIMFTTYLAIYLKAKIDFPQSSVSVDQRICELIGFYIWYSKKIVFSSTNTDKNQGNIAKSNAMQKVGAATSTNLAKGIGGIKNVINEAYKQISYSGKINTELIMQKKQNDQQNFNLQNKNKSQSNFNKKSVSTLCMLANLCQLLLKFMDILNITSKQKKIDKVIQDLKNIKNDSEKELSMLIYLQAQKQISSLYQSRLKTRKDVPTSQSVRIVQSIERNRSILQDYYDKNQVKKLLQSTIKIINKNYFGYLSNMQARGKAELKWFLPKFKQIIGDIFSDQMSNLQKYLRN